MLKQNGEGMGSRCADACFISKKCSMKLYEEFNNPKLKVDTSID